MHCRGCKLLTVGILSCRALILYDSVGTQKSPPKGAHPRTHSGTRFGGTQVDTPQGHALGAHKGTHPRDTLRMWACCITLILQYTKMAWIEKREGSNNYMACWKQNGKKIRKSTGVPISGKPGMPPITFLGQVQLLWEGDLSLK